MLRPVEFGVDMHGAFPFPSFQLNTTSENPFYTLRAGFRGACGGYMYWVWSGGGGCTGFDGFTGTLTNALVHEQGSWEVTPSCESVPGHLPGCNASCEWTLRADVLEDSHGRTSWNEISVDDTAAGTQYPYLPAVPFAWSGTGAAADVFVKRTDDGASPCTVAWAANEKVACPTVAYSSTPTLRLNASTGPETLLTTIPAAEAMALVLFAAGGQCTIDVRIADSGARRPPNLGVVHGQPIPNASSYPFAVATYDGSKTPATGQFCGGSLVAPGWVLTAAHCLYGKRPQELAVHAQAHRRDLSVAAASEGGVDRGIVAYVEHPSYSTNPWLYDLALLQLASPVPSAVATPIELDDGSFSGASAAATVLGWGSMDVACTEYSPVMRMGTVPVATDAECRKTAGGGPRFYNTNLTICAGQRAGTAAAPANGDAWIETGCGDSGGPLVVTSGAGSPVQIGVVSWGSGNSYDVYMRVSGHKAWIESVIGNSSAEALSA